MAKSIPALVTPEVLVWARELDAISVDEIASKMKIPPQKIEEWEDGISYPTLTQAKELARQYRVPFTSIFRIRLKRRSDLAKWTIVLLETWVFRVQNLVN